MQKVIFLIAVLFLAVSSYAQSGEIEVTVSGINVKNEGILKIGVYDQDGFPTVGKSVAGKNITVSEKEVTIILKDIPVGTFAIAVFQDEDSNGELNTNFFGAPSEPYGFSNNKYGTFGPPNFADVSFEILEDKLISLIIKMD